VQLAIRVTLTVATYLALIFVSLFCLAREFPPNRSVIESGPTHLVIRV
jgi:hypothetical protein